MAALPEVNQPTTHGAVLKAIAAAAKDEHRPHLGASLIGRSCARQLWYIFHWADKEKAKPNKELTRTAEEEAGRKQRLFQSGHIQEARVVEDLRRAGIQITDRGEDGAQWRIATFGPECGGHFDGSLDGAGLGFPEAPKTWHVLEVKGLNQKNYDKVVKEGVKKAKPEHYAQMIVYMHKTGMDRAMYLVVNKNTDDIYTERVKADPAEALRLIARAESIIKAVEPPAKISDRADWFECKFCTFTELCHGDQVPEVSCRSCAHSTPDLTGTDGRWLCANEKLSSAPVISLALQRTGCEEHRFIPIFLERTAKPTDYHEGAVVYTMQDGRMFANGDGTNGTFSSAEIRACKSKAVLPDMVALKYEYATAKVVA